MPDKNSMKSYQNIRVSAGLTILCLVFIVLSLWLNRNLYTVSYITVAGIFFSLLLLYNVIMKWLVPYDVKKTVFFCIVDSVLLTVAFTLPLSFAVNSPFGSKKYLILGALLVSIIYKILYTGFLIWRRSSRLSGNLFFLYMWIFLILFPLNLWQNAFRYYGDEAYYVLLAHSLAYDRDVDLANNYRNQDYSSFYEHYLPVQPSYYKNGAVFSSHFPGLPLLIALPYRLLAKEGVILTISLVSSLFILLFYIYITCILPDRRVTLLSTILIFFTAPLLEMYSAVYPEIAAGCVLLALAIEYTKKKPGIIFPALCTLLLAALGIKYLPATAVISLFFLLRFVHREDKWKGVRFIGLLFTAGVLYNVMNYCLYGEVKLVGTAFSHGDGHHNHFTPRVIMSQMYELLLGGRYGLFFCAPLYFLGIYGAIRFFRKHQLGLIVFLVHCLPFFFLDGLPGDSPPARYFIAALPFLAFYIAALIDSGFLKRRVNQVVFILLYGVNILYSFFYIIAPYYRNRASDGNNVIHFFLRIVDTFTGY